MSKTTQADIESQSIDDTQGVLELVSFDLCPYVQRAIIILDEKNIPHKRTYIDLSNKPDWFKEISPLGKVPLLKTEQGVLFESAVIAEYLDETTGAALHPKNHFEKAHHRAWIEFGSSILAGIAGLYSAQEHKTYTEKRALLITKFEQLENKLGTSRYFSSDQFQLIDSVYGPIFRYFDVFESFSDDNFFESTPKVQKYRKNLAERPSIVNAVSQNYPERLTQFLLHKNAYISQLIQKKAA
ncbi:glutathione S-transferase family protein [Kiloniella majae]|uniref:glutathione S-transferase family protein n=1 Tax=Kiloniella majae TaxID=1938558 RepID=UPI000A278516|nr:glutathione S-transferase family protein [Kiloniella majae]